MVKRIDLSEAIYGGLSSSPDKLKLTANVAVVSLFWFSSCTFREKLMLSGEIQYVCVGGLRAE